VADKSGRQAILDFVKTRWRLGSDWSWHLERLYFSWVFDMTEIFCFSDSESRNDNNTTFHIFWLVLSNRNFIIDGKKVTHLDRNTENCSKTLVL